MTEICGQLCVATLKLIRTKTDILVTRDFVFGHRRGSKLCRVISLGSLRANNIIPLIMIHVAVCDTDGSPY
jgi:hypothetical protein